MKILIVQDFLRSGGTERQTVLLAEAFAAAGHETHLVTFRPGGPLCPSPGAANLTVAALQRRDTRLDWWAPGLRRFAGQLAPEVILCMGRMANSYGGALQKALPDAAVISTLRTGKSLPLAYRRSLGLTRHTIANSRAARDHLVNTLAVPPEKTSVIPNGLIFAPRTDGSASPRAETRTRYGAAADDIVLIDVAMFRPEKNQIALVDIAAELDPTLPWRLWLVGDGPALGSCRERVAHLGLTDRVVFPGWQADPRPFYEAADIAVHASRRESLSNFLIEAQAHGLPAIAMAARGVSETFVDGETGVLISSGNRAGFAQAAGDLIKDQKRRAQMAARARSHAREQFSATAQIQAHLDLFVRLTPAAAPA